MKASIQFNRYMVFVAGIYLMSVSGSSYLFASYSNELQNKFNYNSFQISLIGTLGNVGGWAGIIGGLFYDRFGPLPTTIISTIMVFLGYFLVYLAFIGSFFSHHVAIGICLLIMGQGSSWSYTVSLATNVKNFEKKDRGVIVGVLVCFYGLCGGIYTEIYRGFFQHQAQNFILFMGIMFSTVILAFGSISKIIPVVEETEYFRIRIAYFVGIIVAIYLALSNILTEFLPLDNNASLYMAIPLVFMLSWFMIIGIFHVENVVKCVPDQSLTSFDEGLNMSFGDSLPTSSEMSIMKVICRIEYWILFIIFSCSIGSGITTVNNLSNIVISRCGVPEFPVPNLTKDEIPHYHEINTLVIMFSIFNTFGRMGMGIAADKFRFKISREILLVIAVLFMTLVQIYMAFATVEMMYVGVIVLGLSYGGLFCIIPIIVSERYGLENFGGNWGLMGLAPAIGALSLATYLSGSLADRFTNDAKICIIEGSQNSCTCLGTVCYQYTYLVTTGLCSLSTVLGIVVKCYYPSEPLYRGYGKVNDR